jgi:hypothetical protein
MITVQNEKKMPDEQAPQSVNIWLLVFGSGSCLNGYSDATLIEADDKDQAMDFCRQISERQLSGRRGGDHRMSSMSGPM